MVHDFNRFPELTNNQMSRLYMESPHKQIFDDFDAKVTKVIDGDTIKVKVEFRNFEFPIRLAKIAAAELSEGGSTAKEWLTEQIEGEEVRILVDKNNRVGKYGRLIGEVMYMGINMNQQEIVEGLAVEFGKGKLFMDIDQELSEKWE